MKNGILQALRKWRDQQARTEGVETFRVFPNAVLDALAGTLPQNKEEMLSIKGIKDAKYGKYGLALLKIIAEYAPENTERKKIPVADDADFFAYYQEEAALPVFVPDEPLSVSQFLDGLNIELSGMAARIKGEVTSVSERERWIYFSIKDKSESMVSALISRHHYEVSGVKIAEGDEIIVEGCPEVYKPSGRLSLKVHVIELFGEGALKKAYDALKEKLAGAGLFAPERKKELPLYPNRIALITSKDGAAIDDFRMNLGAQGYQIDFYPTSVEGKRAVFEIIEAIRFFNRTPEHYDILVIVRGGGSLESLQAFNNEALTREVAASRIPTLLGIGHEKDVTLAALVADMMVSTPTATAKHLRLPWDEARQLISHFERELPALFRERLADVRNRIALDGEVMLAHLRNFRELVATLWHELAQRLMLVQAEMRRQNDALYRAEQALDQGFMALFDRVKSLLDHANERLSQYDPKRVLQLGYSLVQKNASIIKSITQVAVGDILDVQVGDGKIQTKVEKIVK